MRSQYNMLGTREVLYIKGETLMEIGDLLTVKEVAEIYRIKEDTVYSWLHYNQLPEQLYRKLGRKVVFIGSAVSDWFYNGAELRKRTAIKARKEEVC